MSLLFKSSISNDSDDLMISDPFSTDAANAFDAADANTTNTKNSVDAQTYFDALYDCNNDPWQYQTRWYEKRKRDICLAALPQAQYRRAIELGCGNGVFSELLAERCQHLISLDGNEQAVQLARQRLTPLSHVDVIQGIIPHALSNLANLTSLTNLTETDLSSTSDLDHHASFDLIVISEILYYLSPSDIDAVIAWAKQYLTPNGTLLCCHWRHPIDGFVMTGNTVHHRLDEAFSSANGQKDLFTHQTQMTDADFLLDVWQRSTDSVAMQENLV